MERILGGRLFTMKPLHWKKTVMKAFGYGGEKDEGNRGIIEDELER